jgi:hypothetical protein
MATTSELERLGITDLKSDFSSFNINLDGERAEVVVKENNWTTVDYDVLGIRGPDNKYKGIGGGERRKKVEEAIAYVAKISGKKAYGIWLLL